MDNTYSDKKNINPEDKSSFPLSDLWDLCKTHWYWFVISIAICMGLGITYVIIKTPRYLRQSAVMIKEENGNSLSSMGALGDFGLLSQSSFVYNELAAFSSPDLIRAVVDSLGLETTYSRPGKLLRQAVYGDSLPVLVNVNPNPKGSTYSFHIDMHNGKYTLDNFKLNGKKLDSDVEVHGEIGKYESTPIGTVQIAPGPKYNAHAPIDIKVSRNNPVDVTYDYQKRLKVSQEDEKSSIINLEIEDASPQLAEDFLNTLIYVYNRKWVEDKNKIAENSSDFIRDRLAVIDSELSNVDELISKYKSDNMVPDLFTASGVYLKQATESKAMIHDLAMQAEMARMVKSYLMTPDKKFKVLPMNYGYESTALANQIAAYNDKIVERNVLVANSSANNPLVKDMDAALIDMRKAVEESLDNQILSIEAQIKGRQMNERDAMNQIASSPKQERALLSNERQQKVKEELYLFLLQKNEETALSKAYSAYNTRIIMQPGGETSPSKPRKKLVLIICFILGAAIPVGLLYLRENLNTTIRSRKDLESLSAPLIGEIPLSVGDRKARKVARKVIKLAKKGMKADIDERNIVVQQGNRGIVNEAFRVLRTNLDFMLRKHPEDNVVAVTSFNPGSGKSFVTINMAVTFAIKGKKVVVIDGDLRHGSMSQYVGSPRKGLSDYLIGSINDVNEIIKPVKGYDNLDIIPIGTVPPNPTELLEDGRLQDVIEQLRHEYDVVLIDCPPVDIVADTQIIEQHADRTIFVVRIGLLDREMIKDLQTFYRDKKYKNISVVLNGSSTASGKYGYKYGYYGNDKD